MDDLQDNTGFVELDLLFLENKETKRKNEPVRFSYFSLYLILP